MKNEVTLPLRLELHGGKAVSGIWQSVLGEQATALGWDSSCGRQFSFLKDLLYSSTISIGPTH